MEWTQINWPLENLESQVIRLESKKKQLDLMRPLPTYALHRIKESLTLEWTYNSNSIEGNTLTLQETKVIIEEGITIGGRSLKEHFEAVNHQDAIALIEELAQKAHPLKASEILSVHSLVLQKIEREFAGRYRTSGVRISGANFIPPNALKVDDYMNELISWVNTPDTSLPWIVKVSIFHHRFVWIHPFFDGNGRTVRLIFNLLLMRLGYPPAIILKTDRNKYYTALNKANGGDYSKLILLMSQALERSLDIYLSSLTNTYDNYQPISDIANDSDIPYGQEYISLLARQGKIDAFKEGRNWLTTRDAVLLYATSQSLPK